MSEALSFLDGGGEASRMIRDRDWTGHPLGAPETWPAELRAALSLILNSPEPMILAWGPDLSFFFNETYFPLLGPRLSWAMGERFDKVWADGWEQAKPIIDEAFGGRSRRFVDLPWKLDTDRGVQDTWWTFSYSRVLDARGEIAGLFIFTNETTERVLADRALAASQDELRALNETLERSVEERTAERDRMWNTSPDLMVVLSADGVYRRVNPAWTAVLGYEPDDVIGLYATDLTHPDDVLRSQAAFETAQSGALPSFENRFRHKDGSDRWIQWVAAPGPTEVFAVGRHVTATKEAEARLQAAEEQLRQSQKMEAVGQLTGGLAHDFNNLLAAITGSLELMQARIAQGRTAEVERYVTTARTAAARAAALTHRLLAFSRRQTLDPKPTTVASLVAGLEELLRRTVGPAIALDTRAMDSTWPVLVDPHQLENAILNLCINGRDAMPDGGRLLIESENLRIDEQQAGELDVAPGDYVVLCVEDDGTGMPPHVVERAMEPFFTTKPIGVGTGLGLSMIYGFVRQSDGQVRIRSAVGKGTRVCLYLPRHLGKVGPLSAAASQAPSEIGSVEWSILVVDDEPLVRMLIVDVLADMGCVVLEAGDGPSGMKVLQSDARIDLLITDVGLPNGMNGRQVADAARALRPGLQVLFVTGYAENAVLNHGDLAPGMHIMTKPFSVADLVRRVRAIIAGEGDAS